LDELSGEERAVSRRTELCGVAYAKPGVTIEEVRAKVIEAIGQEDAEIYFLQEDVLEECGGTLALDFGRVPAEGLDADLVEPVLEALAPLFTDCEIECVGGMNWADATIYRIIDGRVDIAAAALAPSSAWEPLSAARTRREGVAHADPDPQD
jgi:hypothetical protein